MKILAEAVLAAILVSSPAAAFTASRGANQRETSTTSLFLEPQELTEYMAKAHEDKLKAVQEMQKTKNAEIQVR